METRILNYVSFIRKYGGKKDEEAIKTRLYNFRQQAALNNKNGKIATYMLEYDALIEDDFRNAVIEEEKKGHEVGLWIEIVQDLVEECSMKWRGREGWRWDWYVDPGFLMSYTEDEKKVLIDKAFEKFKSYFGYYPKVIGAWLIDSFSMEYMSEKYDADAFIICREQWGTDGYSLWGGPYAGPYYPCKNNIQCPAQTEENKIKTPVFRLFLDDVINSYYENVTVRKFNGMDNNVFTLEPAWTTGQNKDFVKFQFDSYFNDKNLGVCYLQLGQETGFKWDGCVEKGLPMQHEFVKNNPQYNFKEMTLGELGRWFKETYKDTPECAVGNFDDWMGKNRKSVWYNSNLYRINIFSDENDLYIRDIFKFDENKRDRYLDTPCTEMMAYYDNLPIMDGNHFADAENDIKAGIYLGKGELTSREPKDGYYEVKGTADGKEFTFKMYKDRIEIEADSDFEMDFVVKENCQAVTGFEEKAINYDYDNIKYQLKLEKGRIENKKFFSENKKIIMKTL